jgi:hypothetical protein
VIFDGNYHWVGRREHLSEISGNLGFLQATTGLCSYNIDIYCGCSTQTQQTEGAKQNFVTALAVAVADAPIPSCKLTVRCGKPIKTHKNLPFVDICPRIYKG